MRSVQVKQFTKKTENPRNPTNWSHILGQTLVLCIRYANSLAIVTPRHATIALRKSLEYCLSILLLITWQKAYISIA